MDRAKRCGRHMDGAKHLKGQLARHLASLYFLVLLTAILVPTPAYTFSGTCAIWAHKRNAFIATNYPGTQAGFDAAKAAMGTNGSIFIYGGCEGSITIGTLQDSVFVYAYDSAKWTVYAKAGSWRDRSGQARLNVDSLGIAVTGKAVVSDSARVRVGLAVGSHSKVNQDYDGSTVRSIMDIRETVTDLSNVYTYGQLMRIFANPGAAHTSTVGGFNGEVYSQLGNAQNFTWLEGHDFGSFHRGSGTLTEGVGGTHTAFIGYPTGGGPVTRASGARNKVSNYSAFTVSDARGSDNRANNHGTGSITNARGIYSLIANTAGGTITNAYGNYIANPDTAGQGAGAITNNYGLYLENQTSATISNYSIYSNGGRSYFAGNTGFGATNPDVPIHGLVTDAVTSAVTQVARVEHQTTGTPANGFGTGLWFSGETSTTANRNLAFINSVWTDITDATRKSRLD